MNRDQFLQFVAQYVAHDPEAAAFIADKVQQGLRQALSESQQRAADMEVALAVSLARRHKGSADIVKQKLEKWEKKTALNWDWLKD